MDNLNVLEKILKNTVPKEKEILFDSTIFMASSLSNLVDNPAEGIHKIKFKDCNCFREYGSVNDRLTNYKCLSCHKKH